MEWQRRRILIWGKTRPEVSKTYREIVCTGGVFADTRRLVRLYPIPLRYMDDERVFKKYQWIEAYVAQATSDPRPESYKIRADDIKVLETIPTQKGTWQERGNWVLRPENIFQSIEQLQERQRADHTSLGLVKPRNITKIESVVVGATEMARFMEKYEEATRQMDLPLDPETGRKIKPLQPSEYRFRVSFRCDDQGCGGHAFSVLDWEVDALYFRMRHEKKLSSMAAAEKVVDKLQAMCAGDKVVYFFVGNISTHPQVFTIVGLWSSKKDPQLDLFAG